MGALLSKGMSIWAKGVVVPVIETILHAEFPTPKGLDVYRLTEPATNERYMSNRGPGLEWKSSVAWTGTFRRDLPAVSRDRSQRLAGKNLS